MADENPLTVYVADNAEVAEAVIRMLESKGIAAETIAPPPRTASDPLTGVSEMITSDSLEVRVADASKVAEAKELLGSAMTAAALRAVIDRRANRTGTVSAVCEECGQSSDWPASAMGTTETCPHCAAYMDVPDPDENWDDVDFGDGEAEDDEESEEGEEMKVEMQTDDSLKHRDDLIQIMKASADFLASRDTDADSEAEAKWRLWLGPNGETWIGLDLRDQDYTRTQQFSPSQLVPADIRELRLVNLWNRVLRARARREIASVNELISQFQGG